MEQKERFETACPKGGTCEMVCGIIENADPQKTVCRCRKCERDMSVEASGGGKEFGKGY